VVWWGRGGGDILELTGTSPPTPQLSCHQLPRATSWQLVRRGGVRAVFYIYRDYPGILIVLIPFWSGMG